MGFSGTFGCTGKGHVERKTSLATLEREKGTYSGLPLLASQKLWFSVTLLGNFSRYARKGGGYLFRARYARLSKVVVFCGTFGCTGKGYVEKELLLLRSRGRRVLIQGSLCSPLKSGGFLWHFWVHQ